MTPRSLSLQFWAALSALKLPSRVAPAPPAETVLGASPGGKEPHSPVASAKAQDSLVVAGAQRHRTVPEPMAGHVYSMGPGSGGTSLLLRVPVKSEQHRSLKKGRFQ